MGSTMNAAFKHAENMAQYLNKCSSTYIIQIALKEMGVSSGYEGFHYAKQSIRILCEKPTATLANGVYLEAGALYDPPADEIQVEQAIRTAIKKAWDERDKEIWECYFPVGKTGRTKCPSNKDFLMAVADFVVLWQGFCEEVHYAKQ